MTTREDELTRIPPCSCDGPGSLECSARFLCEADRAAYAAGKADGWREADTLRAEVARLRAELQNTVTTAYHDEIVQEAVRQRVEEVARLTDDLKTTHIRLDAARGGWREVDTLLAQACTLLDEARECLDDGRRGERGEIRPITKVIDTFLKDVRG
jgi:hypothetical protein